MMEAQARVLDLILDEERCIDHADFMGTNWTARCESSQSQKPLPQIRCSDKASRRVSGAG